ncbi:MAG: phage tail tape measure protein, partial [Ruminococcus sp.]|nr:phage tail tape measure protein [Ruminococcus sp.]
MANKINFQVGYTVDKSGLNEVQNALKQVQQEAASAELSGNLTTELESAAEAAASLSSILNEAWNSKLGQLDLTHVNNEIKEIFTSVSQLKATMEAGGTSGAAAYNKIASSILSTNLQIRESNKLLSSMATTMGNTIKWGIASSAMNSLSGAIQSAWSYTQKLDTSLNDIRIVTEKSAEDMASFAQSANEAAKSLGASTTDYTNASLIYYQQGLSDEEAQKRAEVTLKAANVTGQAASEVSEQLTAVWNGYNIATEDAEQAVDVLAAVAASTASDLEELSTGMSKVASAASAMGVGEEQLAAQLSTIISVTRQAPESVGTALKTIYARMSDIEAGVDEEGATLGSYTAEMANMGINVLDATGSLRDMGEVIEEIGTKWSDFSREQQVALAQTMAGTRQYNNLIALFNNWDDYLDALDVANNAEGTLQEQQDIYMESIAAHLQQLKTAGEGVYDSLTDTDAINTAIDGLTKLVELFNNFIDSANAGFGSFTTLGLMIANIFNNQIGKAIEKQISNFQIMRQNQASLALVQETANAGISSTGNTATDAAYSGQVERAQQLLNVVGSISQEDYNRLNTLNTEIKDIDLAIAAWRECEKEITNETFSLEEQSAILANQTNELKQRRSLYQILNTLNTQGQLTDEQQVTLEKQLNSYKEKGILTEQEYTTLINRTKNTQTDIASILQQQEESIKRQQSEVDTLNSKIKARQSFEQNGAATGAALQNQRNAAQNAFSEGSTDENGNHLLGVDEIAEAQRIAQLTQGLTSLFMIMSSIKSIGSILTNEDLTPFEKFSQIASNLLFTLPMILNSAKSLQNLGSNLAEVFDTAATKLNTKAQQENTQARKANAAATEEQSVAQTKNSLTQSIEGFKQMGTAIKNTTTAFGNLIMANSSVASSLGGVIGAGGVAVATLGAVAAVIAVTVVAVRAGIRAYNAQKIAAEEAAEAAEQVADANDQVTESYDNLQSVIDTYDSAKEQLDECVEGTEEWKDALEETTTAAIELLNTISGLKGIDLSSLVSQYGELYNSSTGEFNEDILDAIEEQYSQIVNASNMATAQADYNSSTLSAQSDLLNSVRSNAQGQTYDEYGNAYGMTATQIQSILMDNIDQLAGLIPEDFEQALNDLNIGQYVTDFDALQTAVNDYATATNNATIALEAIADVQVADVLGDTYEDYDNETAIFDAVSNQLAAQTASETEKLLNNWASNMMQASTGSNSTYQGIVSQLQAAGYDYSGVSGQKAVKGNDKNRTFTFQDSEGEEVELTDDAVAAMLAAATALGNVEDNATAVATAFKNLEDNVSEGASSGIEDYITSGNFESMTRSELEALLAEVGVEEASELTAEAMSAYLQDAMGLTEEELAQLFGGEDFADDMVDAVNNYETALDSYTEGLLNSTQEAFNNLDISDDVSVASGKYIADALQGAIIYGTEDTLTTLENTFSQIGTDELDDFAGAIQDIDDWSSITTDDLIDILDDADVSIDLTEEELQAFIDAMEKTAEATQSTTAALQETYASIHEIIDGLETGDTISADDYTTLAGEIGDAADEYFTMMLDGTYKLTGDAEDFYELVQSQQISNFSDNIAELQEKIAQQQKVQDYDYESLSENQNYQNDAGENKYNASDVEKQIELLEALDAVDPEKIAEWRDELEDGHTSVEMLQEIADEVAANEEAFNNLDDAIEANKESILGIELAIAESADSYEQLKEYLDEGTISAQAFNQVYSELWDAERVEDLDSDEIEEYAEHLQDIADESEDLSDDLIGNEEAAEDLAIQIMNMNDAIDDLADNWEEWSDILSKSSKESEEYSETINDVKDAMSKLLDIDNEFISDDLILNNMNDIAAAAEGDADAIDRLRAAALDDIIINLELKDSSLNEQLAVDVSNLQAMLDEMGNLQVGTEIDDTDFIAACNEMIESAGLTVDQVNALFSAMGYEVNVATEEQPVVQRVPEYVTETVDDGTRTETLSDGTEVTWLKTRTHTYQDGYYEAEGIMDAVAMSTNGETPVINSITKKATGSFNNYSSKNSGGSSPGSSSGSGSGSGSSSEDEPDVMDYLEDEIDLYHDINLELEEISTNLSRLQKQESKLTGQALLDNLNDQLATLNDQIDATNEKISIAEGEAASLRAELSAQGVTFDSDGYITNYASIVESKLAYVNSCIDKYNAMSAEEQEAYKDTLEDIKDDYQDFIDAISDYDTLISETIPGLEDDIQDAIDEQIEIQITKFTMEVEIRLDMEEAEKDWNEFYRKVILGLDDDDILGNATQDLADILSYFNTTASDITDLSSDNLSDWADKIAEAIS